MREAPATTGIDPHGRGGGAALRRLHVAGAPLVVPNAWDAASARMIEAAGFPAVATSSAAMAAVLGHDDGERAPVGEVLAAAARIVRAVRVPSSAEAGSRGCGSLPRWRTSRSRAATGTRPWTCAGP
ncbi:isocitrate lyase/phosphoenolpyruvate mutase family protein [[Actinomadura] parvosata]|uniref:isocitrate lyase/phosphoenolpyruvate mutase family protein n=1 Tax=[Actinomadura] parvosata TaxID=1955412 RepID=UPI00406C1311